MTPLKDRSGTLELGKRVPPMEAGLLWFDDDPGRDLGTKITAAAQRYEQKFGRRPNICYVNPTTLNGNTLEQNGVRVLAVPHIPPHHFWLGVQRRG